MSAFLSIKSITSQKSCEYRRLSTNVTCRLTIIDKYWVLSTYRLRFRWSTLIDMLRPGFWCKFVIIIALRTFAPKSSHAQIIFKLAMQKGNDLLLPKRRKNWGSLTSFWRERSPKNTLNLKNRASLANKAMVSVSPKILQLDLWSENFSAKYCLSGPIKWI